MKTVAATYEEEKKNNITYQTIAKHTALQRNPRSTYVRTLILYIIVCTFAAQKNTARQDLRLFVEYPFLFSPEEAHIDFSLQKESFPRSSARDYCVCLGKSLYVLY